MGKAVQCFIYTDEEKVGKGVLDFFEEKYFKTFLKEGGSVTIRWEEGDTAVHFRPFIPIPTDKECSEVCNELDDFSDRVSELIIKQPKSVQEDMRVLMLLLAKAKKTINKLQGQ